MNDKEDPLFDSTIRKLSLQIRIDQKAFKNLLNRLYASDEEIQKLSTKLRCGEATVVNITRKDKSYCGSDDTLYALLLNMKTI